MRKYFLLSIAAVLSLNILAFAAPDKWKDFKTTHFLIYYKNAPEEFIRQVGNQAEEYYGRITDELGFNRFDFWLWDDRARIYIYDDAAAYQAGTGLPAWSEGAAIPGSKLIQTFVGTENFLESTLPHEIGHIIFREFVGFKNPAVPLWLEEGVASYQEKLKYAGANRALRGVLAKNKFMDLTSLSQFQTFSRKNDDDGEVGLFYLESFSLLDFLLKKYGRDNFVSFCRDLRDEKNLGKALSSNYHFSNLKELGEAWQEYVGKE